MGPTSPAQPMPATLVEPVAAQPPLPVDLIRAVAVFLVLLLHAAAEPVIAQLPPTEAWRWWAAHGYDSLARPCVPMFVMLSGALLLAPGKHEDLPSFFRKRLGRIGLPFLFWAAVHFAWRLWVQHEPLTLIGVARNLVEGSPYFHFWFIYMLLGLYLVTPGLRALLAAASTATLRYLLALWFIATAGVPLLARWTGVNLGSSGMLTLTGFVGYFVLGAYLRNHLPRLRTAALLWLLGLGWTVLATWRATVAANGHLDTFYYEYLSANVILAAIGAYSLLAAVPVQSLALRWPRATRTVDVIGADSFAIYFVHVLVLKSFQAGYFGFELNTVAVNPVLGIPLLALAGMLVSFALVRVLRLLPGSRRWVG